MRLLTALTSWLEVANVGLVIEPSVAPIVIPLVCSAILELVESLIVNVNANDYLIVEGFIRAFGILKVITPLDEATALGTVRIRVYPDF